MDQIAIIIANTDCGGHKPTSTPSPAEAFFDLSAALLAFEPYVEEVLYDKESQKS